MQIGHSSRGGGSLNNSSSNNSAARFSHFFLCFDRCFCLQYFLQYTTKSHLLHAFNFVSSLHSLPQFAHNNIAVVIISVSLAVMASFSLLLFDSLIFNVGPGNLRTVIIAIRAHFLRRLDRVVEWRSGEW